MIREHQHPIRTPGGSPTDMVLVLTEHVECSVGVTTARAGCSALLVSEDGELGSGQKSCPDMKQLDTTGSHLPSNPIWWLAQLSLAFLQAI